MRTVRDRSLAALLLLIVPLLAGTRAGGETEPGAALRADERLRKEVSASFPDRPLSAVLTALGSQLQVKLTASRDVADDKVTLFTGKRPAADLLGDLARHFDFRWQRSGEGYELVQDAASRQREASRREQDRTAQLAEIENRLERVGKLVDTPAPKLEARQADLQTQWGNPAITAEEREKLRQEWLAIRDALHAGARAGLALLHSLTPAQQAALRGGTRIRLSTEDRSLSPAVAEQAHRFVRQQVQGIGQYNGPNPEQVGQVPAPLLARAEVKIEDEGRYLYGPPRRGDHRLRLYCGFTSSEGLRGRSVGVAWAPDFDTADPAPRPPKETKDPDLLRPIRLELTPLAEAERRNFEELQPLRRVTGGDLPQAITLGELARALHQASGLELMADGFVRARLEPRQISVQTTPASLLELLERELEYDWEKEGRRIRLTSRRRHWDRPAEVPDRILAPWRTRVTRTGAPTLDDLGDLATALTDPQLRGLSEYWSWYLPRTLMVTGLYGNRAHLRLWGALNGVQRKAALAGEVLPTARLNPVQQVALKAGVQSMGEQTGLLDRQLLPLPTLEQVAAGGFSVDARPGRTRQVYESGDPNNPYMKVHTLQAGVRAPAQITSPTGIRLKPRGREMQSESYLFRYHLAGEERPRSTMIMISRVVSPPR